MEKAFFLHSLGVDKISLMPYPLIEEGQERGNALGVSENSDRADGGGDAAAVT